MRRFFPEVESAKDFARILRSGVELRAGVAAICDALQLRGAVDRFPEGSRAVYSVGESLVLKLYPPQEKEEQQRESALLEVLENRLPLPTPSVHALGDLEEWPYLLMSRLRGESLAVAWPRIPADNRERIAADLGDALRELHAIRDSRLAPARVDWPRFLDQQRATAVERQRAHGLGSPWLAQIDDMLAATSLGKPSSDCPLHTEVMREHLLVERGPAGFTLSGIFDFEPSMIGAAEYEFASVGPFFSCGEPALLRRLLLSYGYAETALDSALERRLLAYSLLHRYSNLSWYLRRMPLPAGVTSLESLASHFWGVAEAR